MAQKKHVVVARIRDRTYLAPRVCSLVTSGVGEDAEYLLDVEVEIADDGQAHFRRIDLRPMGKVLTPSVVQHIPWRRVAERAITVAAAEGDRGTEGDVRAARARATKAREGRRRTDEARSRQPVTTDRLRTVLELREEARAAGAPRWDDYAARRLSEIEGRDGELSSAYLRALALRAEAEGVIARPSRGRRRS